MTHSSLALALTFTTAGTLFAQQGVFRARTDVVAIDVSVMDGKKAVTSLTMKDFRLTDEGVAQTLIDVGREPMPLDITLTIDISGSVSAEQRATIERAIQQVSATLRAEDRCSVVSFDGHILEEAPLHQPPLRFTLTKRSAGTSLIDALLLSMVTAPTVGRRQLNLVLTDGIDTTSFFDRARVTDTMKYANGQTSVVLVGGRYVPVRDNATRELLNDVTATSGGQVVVLNRDEELSATFLAALEEFRTSYLLRYTPTGVSRSGWHAVKVTVNGRSNNAVRARQGYWY
jgi:hypothetical protein